MISTCPSVRDSLTGPKKASLHCCENLLPSFASNLSTYVSSMCEGRRRMGGVLIRWKKDDGMLINLQ